MSRMRKKAGSAEERKRLKPTDLLTIETERPSRQSNRGSRRGCFTRKEESERRRRGGLLSRNGFTVPRSGSKILVYEMMMRFIFITIISPESERGK